MPGGGESGSAPEGFALLFLQNLPGFPPKDLQVGGQKHGFVVPRHEFQLDALCGDLSPA
jgi:hypothetical protein